MTILTSRERVIRALNHQEPDLVPIDIGSTAAWFTDITYERIKEFFGLESEGDHFRLGENAGHYDDKLLDMLKLIADEKWQGNYIQNSSTGEFEPEGFRFDFRKLPGF